MFPPSRQVTVLKFGSSVLKTPTSMPVAVTEVYRHFRHGHRVIAVVSAFEGVTDQLLADARSFAGDPDPATLAVALSTGEIASATQLVFALHNAGIPARYVDPREIGLTATGDRLNADLSEVRVDQLNSILEESRIAVIPGFFARAADGGLALLGRGGTDLTALYLAAELKVGSTLLKDVDGLYESDPAIAGAQPRRFMHADYATAEALGGALVQPKAIRFARDRRLDVDITRIGQSRWTRIGEAPSCFAHSVTARRIRVALLGLGTVGGGVLEYLEHFPERFEVVAALVRSPEKHIARGIPRSLLVTAPDVAFARQPDIVVEALPGVEPARQCMAVAIAAGVHVVTANKALLAADWSSLYSQLVGPRRQLRYAATVGGAVPMLEHVESLACRSPISRLRGVINGTCNFVQDQLARGMSLSGAVRLAQEKGFAEADPTSDLSGLDAARKIEILGRIAFGGTPTSSLVVGLSEQMSRPVADATGRRRVERLVAEAVRTPAGFTFKVAPESLASEEFLAGTRGAENRLEITTGDGAVLRLQGLGAGRVPTSTAVFADILEHGCLIDAEEDSSAARPVPVDEPIRA
jgi:homoserine dehydrogenase